MVSAKCPGEPTLCKQGIVTKILPEETYFCDIPDVPLASDYDQWIPDLVLRLFLSFLTAADRPTPG